MSKNLGFSVGWFKIWSKIKFCQLFKTSYFFPHYNISICYFFFVMAKWYVFSSHDNSLFFVVCSLGVQKANNDKKKEITTLITNQYKEKTTRGKQNNRHKYKRKRDSILCVEQSILVFHDGISRRLRITFQKWNWSFIF